MNSLEKEKGLTFFQLSYRATIQLEKKFDPVIEWLTLNSKLRVNFS